MSTIGTTRRLQALQAMGWSHLQLARIFVVSRGVITRAMHGEGTFDDPFVTQLYPSLVNGPQKPSHHVLQSAKKAGYAPPDEWEGVDMDDPDACPQRVRVVPRQLHGLELAEFVELRINGKATAAEISLGAGYPEVQRCAELLARMRQAPLGRALQDRHQLDRMAALMTEKATGATLAVVR